MNERSKSSEEAFYELPPQLEGLEAHLEKSIEGQTGADNPSAVKTADSNVVIVNDTTASAATPSGGVLATDSSTQQGVPLTDDTENQVVEKQWVERAKDIIYKYRDNPYQQRKEFGKVKAAYMKERFNKILKVEEAG